MFESVAPVVPRRFLVAVPVARERPRGVHHPRGERAREPEALDRVDPPDDVARGVQIVEFPHRREDLVDWNLVAGDVGQDPEMPAGEEPDDREHSCAHDEDEEEHAEDGDARVQHDLLHPDWRQREQAHQHDDERGEAREHHRGPRRGLFVEPSVEPFAVVGEPL